MTDILTTNRLQQKIQAAIAAFGPKVEVFAYAICLAQRNEDHEWYTAHKREGTFTVPKAPIVVPEKDGHQLISIEPEMKAGGSTPVSIPENSSTTTPSTKAPSNSKTMKKPLRTSKPKPKKAQTFTGKPSASRFK